MCFPNTLGAVAVLCEECRGAKRRNQRRGNAAAQPAKGISIDGYHNGFLFSSRGFIADTSSVRKEETVIDTRSLRRNRGAQSASPAVRTEVLGEIHDERGLIFVLDGCAPRPHLRHRSSPGRGVLALLYDQRRAVAQQASLGN